MVPSRVVGRQGREPQRRKANRLARRSIELHHFATGRAAIPRRVVSKPTRVERKKAAAPSLFA